MFQRAFFSYSSHDQSGSGHPARAEDKSLNQHSQPESVEPDTTPGSSFLVLIVVLLLGLVGIGFAVRQLVWYASSSVKHDVDLSVVNPALTELRASEEKALTTYDVVDEKSGFYQIPIDRAVELYVKRENAQGH